MGEVLVMKGSRIKAWIHACLVWKGGRLSILGRVESLGIEREEHERLYLEPVRNTEKGHL